MVKGLTSIGKRLTLCHCKGLESTRSCLIKAVSTQASDNTRHRSVNPSTGEPFLLPAHGIKRVVLCTGQVYYHLSGARRARRIRDIVLVRLEQIAPFPSDLLIKASFLFM